LTVKRTTGAGVLRARSVIVMSESKLTRAPRGCVGAEVGAVDGEVGAAVGADVGVYAVNPFSSMRGLTQ